MFRYFAAVVMWCSIVGVMAKPDQALYEESVEEGGDADISSSIFRPVQADGNLYGQPRYLRLFGTVYVLCECEGGEQMYCRAVG